MARFITIMTTCFLIANLAQAGKVVGPLGQMAFETSSKDFGQVTQGSVLTHSFVFKNVGSGNLAIQGIFAACGCTAVEALEKKVYAPGESGTIDVSFDTTHFAGSVHKTVSVTTNEASLPTRILNLRAKIIQEIVIDPPVADFGDVLPGSSPSRVFSVKFLNPEITVTSVRYDKDDFTVKFEPKESGGSLSVKINPNRPTGHFRKEIFLVNSSKVLPEVLLPVSADIQGNLQVAPSYLTFGAIAPSGSKAMDLKVQSTGPHKLGKVSYVVHVNGEKKPDDRHYVDVVIPDNQENVTVTLRNPGSDAGSVHGTLKFETNDPTQKIIDVDFYGFFKE